MRILSFLFTMVFVIVFCVADNAQPHEFRAAADDIDPAQKAEALNQEQAELQKEYEDIEEAKALIGDPPGPDASFEAYEEYNRKAEEINSRIEEYRKRQEEHEKRVKEHNEMFGQ